MARSVKNIFSWEPALNLLLKENVPASLSDTNALVRHITTLNPHENVVPLARTVAAMHVLKCYPAFQAFDVGSILPYLRDTEVDPSVKKDTLIYFWQEQREKLSLPQSIHIEPISDRDHNDLYIAKCFVQESAANPSVKDNGFSIFSSAITSCQKKHHDFLYGKAPSGPHLSRVLTEHAPH